MEMNFAAAAAGMLLHAFFGKGGPRPPLCFSKGGPFPRKGGPNFFRTSMNAQNDFAMQI